MNRRKFFGSLLVGCATVSAAMGMVASLPAPTRQVVLPVDVFLNGKQLQSGTDYKLFGDLITFNAPIPSGSTVLCAYPLKPTPEHNDRLGVQITEIHSSSPIHSVTVNSSAWHYPSA